jgi:hypothetical protein
MNHPQALSQHYLEGRSAVLLQDDSSEGDLQLCSRFVESATAQEGLQKLLGTACRKAFGGAVPEEPSRRDLVL